MRHKRIIRLEFRGNASTAGSTAGLSPGAPGLRPQVANAALPLPLNPQSQIRNPQSLSPIPAFLPMLEKGPFPQGPSAGLRARRPPHVRKGPSGSLFVVGPLRGCVEGCAVSPFPHSRLSQFTRRGGRSPRLCGEGCAIPMPKTREKSY